MGRWPEMGERTPLRPENRYITTDQELRLTEIVAFSELHDRMKWSYRKTAMRAYALSDLPYGQRVNRTPQACAQLVHVSHMERI